MKLTECKLYLFYKLTTYDILSGKRLVQWCYRRIKYYAPETEL